MEKTNKLRRIETYFFCFFIYSVIGWIYETVLELFVYQTGFSNRGTLFGSYLPIYGVGAILFLLALSGLKKKKIKLGPMNITPVLIFLGCGIIATVAELIGSYVAEWITGGWMWDYTRFAFDFQGRIALNPSVRFAIGGFLFMYVVQPLLDRLTEGFKDKTLHIICGVIFVVMLVDGIIKFTG